MSKECELVHFYSMCVNSAQAVVNNTRTIAKGKT